MKGVIYPPMYHNLEDAEHVMNVAHSYVRWHHAVWLLWYLSGAWRPLEPPI